MDKGEFILLNSAGKKYSHTQFQEVYGPIPAFIYIHPKDAGTLDLSDNDEAILYNESGNVVVNVRISDMVREGVIWSPRQFEDKTGTPLNILTSYIPQKIGGGATFNSTIVRIRKT